MMSKKKNVTETPEQDKKIVTRYDRRMQRRKEQEEKLRREHKITMGISIVILVAAVALILSFPIRTFVAVNREFIKVGGEKVTRVEFDYYYHLAINAYYNQFGAYLSYMGLDLSSDLSAQMYSDTLTWEDYFQKSAVQNIQSNRSLLKAAKADGFVYDTSGDIEDFRENSREQAASAGVSVDNYLKSTYGSYATMGRLEDLLEDICYLTAYYEQKQQEMTPAEEEITAYYEENKDNYDSVDYRVIQIEAELPTEPTELADPETEESADASEEDSAESGEASAEGGEEEAYQPSEAEIEAAMAQAKAKAEEAQKTIETDAELVENTTRSSLNYNYSSWLFDAERTEGETTIIEDSTYHSYYVVQFVKRYRDDTPRATFRAVVTDEMSGEDVLSEWTSGAATEESFIELCNKYSEDTSVKDGFYDNISKSSLSDEMRDWLYAEERTAGDTTVIQSEDGTVHYVIYYVGGTHPEWYYSIQTLLLNDVMEEYLENLTADCTVEDRKGNLNYLAVEASVSAAQESSEAEASGETEESTQSSAETEESTQSSGETEESAQSSGETGESTQSSAE